MPSIEFSRVPPAEEGGAQRVSAIEGRVIGARPGQQIVLYARSGAWYVQPFIEQPFTIIQPDATWKNSTHLGTEYAALLVGPEYRPPTITDELPKQGDAIVAVAVVKGNARLLVPAFWQSWWFRFSAGFACLLALFAFHRLRMRQLTHQLNARFEERLAERTRIAQEIQDTLLQGFLSASMQLYVAVDQVPENSPAKPRLNHVQQLMGKVIEEGRNTVRGMRFSSTDSFDLVQAFSRVGQEFPDQNEIDFRVIVEGRIRPLHPILRHEAYRIGRQALVNAFRHARAKSIEVKLVYAARRLRILVRDDGCGIDPQALRSASDAHSGLSSLREQAKSIGARLKIRSRLREGTEVELTVPGKIAFQTRPSAQPRRWATRLSLRRAGAMIRKLTKRSRMG